MSYKGGSVLFKSIENIEQQIIKLLSLNPKIEILTEQPHQAVIIYKLIFKEPLSNYFFGLSSKTPLTGTNVSPRSLIIKYSYDNPDNEAVNQGVIASSLNSSNLFPIAPTMIYSEYIKYDDSGQSVTHISRSFIHLLAYNVNDQTGERLLPRLKRHVKTLIAKDAKKYTPDDCKERIIIMEMIDGTALYKIMGSIPENIPENPMFLQKFFTFYLLILSLEKSIWHGDPHTNNIMLANDTTTPFFIGTPGTPGTPESPLHMLCSILLRLGLNRVPYIIDFGRAAPISDMRFQEFTPEEVKIAQTSYRFYGEIYSKLLPMVEQRNIENIILDYIIRQNKYVEAILILTMCQHAMYFSMFNQSYSVKNFSTYNHLFSVTSDEAQQLNMLIGEAIFERKNRERQLHQLHQQALQAQQAQQAQLHQQALQAQLHQQAQQAPQALQAQYIQYIHHGRYEPLSHIDSRLHDWYLAYLFDYYIISDETTQETMLQSIRSIDINIYNHLQYLVEIHNKVKQNKINTGKYLRLSDIHHHLHTWYIAYLKMEYFYRHLTEEQLNTLISPSSGGTQLEMNNIGTRYQYTKHQKKNQKKINKTRRPKKLKKPKQLKKIKKIKTRKNRN